MKAAVTTATSTQDESLLCGFPFGDVTVLKPLRGRVPLPASGVPGRAGYLVFPIVTSARRNALRITRWHGTGDVHGRRRVLWRLISG